MCLTTKCLSSPSSLVLFLVVVDVRLLGLMEDLLEEISGTIRRDLLLQPLMPNGMDLSRLLMWVLVLLLQHLLPLCTILGTTPTASGASGASGSGMLLIILGTSTLEMFELSG